MAASLSRPDPSSPASVAEASFSTTRRGFHPDEVRAFLTAVAAEMSRLSERERQLEAELREARAMSAPAELDEDTVAKLLGEETLRVLQTARESASEIKIRAEETAARVLREGTDEANRLRQDAEVEAARRRQDAQSDAESEVAIAKQQGREMVNEARAYRERVLADLERRTTLARHQIEELMHGRDRLLQVFERARLVAVDVTSGLREVDQPDELVNLTPTTGPVPIMVPNQPRPESESAEPGDEAAPSAEADPEPTADDEVTDEMGEVETGSDATDTEVTDDADDTVTDDTDDAVTDDTVTDDADDADDTVTDDTVVATEPNGRPSDNVVSLFGGRAPAQEAAEADDHPSVDDIFERLRHETDTDDPSPDETGGSPTTDTTIGEVDPPETSDAADADTEIDEIVEPTAFGRRDEALVPLIVAGARRLKRVLADEQNEVLDTLRQGEPVEVLDALVPRADEHSTAYTAALADELTQAVGAGALEGGARNNKTTRAKLVKAGALDRANDQVRAALVGPLRDRLDRAINDGDGDNDDITKRVRAVYREWKTQHIDAGLDDVFRHAFSDGLATAVEPGTPLVWTIDPSAVACPDCEDNSLAGAVSAGEAFPTGHPAAPAHPGCRCLALPVE